MGPHLTTTYSPTSTDIFRSETSGWGLKLSGCLRATAILEIQGSWVGIAVTRETGICLTMIHSGGCVGLGDAANQSSVFDPKTNADTGVTHKQTAWHIITCAASVSRVLHGKQRWQANNPTQKQFSSLVYSRHKRLLINYLVGRKKHACAFLGRVF